MTAPPRDASRHGAASVGTRRAAPLAAVVAAAGSCAVLHGVSLAASGVAYDGAYLLVCAGLAVGGSACVGGLAVLGRLSVAVALAVWAVAAAALESGLEGALAMTACAALGARAGRGRGEGPWWNGMLAGGAFVLALGAGPRLAFRLGRGERFEPFLMAAAFLVLWGGGRWLAARLEGRWAPSAVFVATACALVALAARPLVDGRRGRPTGSAPAAAGTGPAAGGDLVLLVLDTVRADHLSVYGYERETTPELAELVASRPGAQVYPTALSNGTWTVPSHASLLTGLAPSRHGARLGRGDGARYALEAERTLAEVLRAAGYRTLSVYGNTWLSRIAGMERGFDHYRQSGMFGKPPPIGERLRELLLPSVAAEGARPTASAGDVSAGLLAALDGAGPGPAFLFANFVDAHAPYLPPRDLRGRFAPWSPFERPEHLAIAQSEAEKRRLEARYDECIAGLDRDLGLLFDELEARGRLADAWIVITSDHGEAFGEHGVTEHGTTVYGEVTHIPLVVVPPAGVLLPAPSDPASLVDVAATLAGVAGAEWTGGGRDLREPAASPAEPTLVEFYGDPAKARRHGELARLPARALVEGSLKLVVHGGASELYDLDADPGELRDLAAERPEDLRRLEDLLGEWDAAERSPQAPAVVGSDADLQALRDMGYLGDD
ncbi:MAG: sulfatase [Planctomycetota bacterium]|nr:sulfatase [Planctomycetota bacterium]MDP6990628.1 sulfatase [Planctomycetota bacterium]